MEHGCLERRCRHAGPPRRWREHGSGVNYPFQIYLDMDMITQGLSCDETCPGIPVVQCGVPGGDPAPEATPSRGVRLLTSPIRAAATRYPIQPEPWTACIDLWYRIPAGDHRPVRAERHGHGRGYGDGGPAVRPLPREPGSQYRSSSVRLGRTLRTPFGGSFMSRIVDFLIELKARRVYRVAAMYGVVAWIVIEAASVIVPELLLPPALTRGIIVLALLGFPLALVLAWAYDIGHDGVRRAGRGTDGSSDDGSQPTPTLQRTPAQRRWVPRRRRLCPASADASAGFRSRRCAHRDRRRCRTRRVRIRRHRPY
jgi:hypothetical protein